MRNALQSILNEINALRRYKLPVLVAIDGRCASGKTTLSANLQESLGCNVLHMDHFFLRPEQRTAERLNEPGGNVDYERFLQEVLLPLQRGEPFTYHPFDCTQQAMGEAIAIQPLPVSVIEGSYACHPTLEDYYDLKIFLTVNETEQLRRITTRNGEVSAAMFQSKWIPLEERYFSAFDIKKRCGLCIDTSCSVY